MLRSILCVFVVLDHQGLSAGPQFIQVGPHTQLLQSGQSVAYGQGAPGQLGLSQMGLFSGGQTPQIITFSQGQPHGGQLQFLQSGGLAASQASLYQPGTQLQASMAGLQQVQQSLQAQQQQQQQMYAQQGQTLVAQQQVLSAPTGAQMQPMLQGVPGVLGQPTSLMQQQQQPQQYMMTSQGPIQQQQQQQGVQGMQGMQQLVQPAAPH